MTADPLANAATPIAGPVAVLGVGLWLPGWPTAAAWAAGARDPAATRPLGRAFDKVNRRRVGLLGRAVGDALAEAAEQALVDLRSAPTIVGSALGEATTMLGLLDQMYRQHVPMSPAAFTVSVHNAASGLLSISQQNRGFATSLAADHDTPAAVLLEGIGIVLSTEAPVAVVCADEAIPESLAQQAAPWDLLAAAIVLGPADAASARAQLSITTGGAMLPPAALDALYARNPQAGMADLVDAVLHGRTGVLALDRGDGRGYAAMLARGSVG